MHNDQLECIPVRQVCLNLPESIHVTHINKIKIILLSINGEISSGQNSISIHDKILNKLYTDRKYHHIIRAIHDKPQANIILNGKELKLSSKIRNKTRIPTLTIFIQHSTGHSGQSN